MQVCCKDMHVGHVQPKKLWAWESTDCQECRPAAADLILWCNEFCKPADHMSPEGCPLIVDICITFAVLVCMAWSMMVLVAISSHMP